MSRILFLCDREAVNAIAVARVKSEPGTGQKGKHNVSAVERDNG